MSNLSYFIFGDMMCILLKMSMNKDINFLGLQKIWESISYQIVHPVILN